MWKICVPHPFKNCELVFPTKQKYVREIIDTLSPDPNVRRLTVFGSAVSWTCNPWSDVDIYAELERPAPRPLFRLGTEVDFWDNFTADDRLKVEIARKGVTVYEGETA